MEQAKRVFTIILIGAFLQISCQDDKSKKAEPEIVESKKMEKQNEDLLRHVVIFKFNDDASEADVEKLNDSFNALPDHISVIKDFEWGLNDSPENFHQGFTHCYMLTFHSAKDRDSVYTPHPKHQEFVASLQPFVEKVFVVDYWVK
ncbi:Dabb family protein [Maribacter sp. 2308TA10-17]|uniref:Dabb family protein n=1 Tax=Maribacter sp. 2308TA10-17 TaxID=3386276 RepID=UPI0039BC80F2